MKRLAFLLLSLLPMLAFTAETLPAQMWNNTTCYLPLGRGLSSRFEAQIRTQLKNQKFLHRHYEVEVIRPLLPFLSLGVGYRQSDLVENQLEKDHMPFVTLSAAASKNRWRVEYRARAEYLFFERVSSQDTTLYRHRLDIDIPLKFNRMTLHTFLSDELFFKEGERVSENRFKVGIRELMNKTLMGDIFYQFRTVKLDSGTWGQSSDIGIYTTLLF